MADKNLQDRTMRKTVERVDIGVFGVPMKTLSWVRKKKSSWGGLIAMSVGQAAIGVAIALIAGLILGVPANAFSISILVGFALGSAIGGPFSFVIWSTILVLLTGLIAGLTVGTWVSSPNWWRLAADGWSNGETIPKWFMIAVPCWMLFWIAASRGVSKLAEFSIERTALRVGFRKANEYKGEEKRVFEDAFEQADVSEAETQSLLESSGDGTMSVITGEPSKVGGYHQPSMREMGGDPDVSNIPLPDIAAASDDIDYDSFINLTNSDPDIMKAVGKKPTGLESLEQPTDAVENEDSNAEAPVGVVIEMEPLNLPDVPRDTSAPMQRMEAPKLDPRQNRALIRRMSQMNLAFMTAQREDSDAEFIEKHHAELASMSDEQKQILNTMDGSGPLLAVIQAVQQKIAEDFLVGRADAPVAPGTGTVDAVEEPEPIAMDAQNVAEAEASEDDDVPFDVPMVAAAPEAAEVVKLDAAMASSQEADEEARSDASPLAPADDAIQSEASDASSTEDAPAPAVRDMRSIAAAFSQTLSTRMTRRSAPKIIEATEEHEDDASASKAVPSSDSAAAPEEPESSTDMSLKEKFPFDMALDEAVELTPEGIQRDVTVDVGVETSEPQGDAEPRVEEPSDGVEADLQSEEEAAVKTTEDEDETAVASQDEGVLEPEEEMNNETFNRSICRQVLALVSSPLAAGAKADDVQEFEKEHPGISVAAVLNSRSFDEQVGNQIAAAARHSWTDIKRILSQSGIDRLKSDLERVNHRGEMMIEEPHTLSVAAYHAFETESSHLRRVATAPGEGDAVSLTADLVQRNVKILDDLAAILKSRNDAAAKRSPSLPGGLVRQRVAPGRDDEVASRGRSLIAGVLGTARTAGVGVMRDGPAKDIQAPEAVPASEQIIEQDASVAVPAPVEEENVMTDVADASAVALVKTSPSLGEEGFVSSFAPDSPEYAKEMRMHAAALEFEAELKARAEKEEQDRLQAIADEEAENERKREKEESDRLAAEKLQQDRLRQEKEDEDERQRLANAESERRRLELEAEDALRRENLHRIELETAESARIERENAAKASALALEKAQADAARSKEDEAIIRQFRERQQDMEVPERFRSEDVINHVFALAELRSIRKTFQKSIMNANVGSLSPIESAMRFPPVRSQLQTDAETVKEAVGIIMHIASVVDAPNPEDKEAMKGLLNENEIPFYVKTMNIVERGRAASMTLLEVEKAEDDIRARAEKATVADELKSNLDKSQEELKRLRTEASTSSEAVQAANSRAEQAEREREALLAQLEKLKKEMSGVIDDDFQKVLEIQASRVDIKDIANVEGFFSFTSPDKSALVIVMTTPASIFPEGLIQRGSKALTVPDFIEFVVSKERSFDTDSISVFYTDPQIRPYVAGSEGVTLKQIRRSVEELKTSLLNYGINIEGE